MKERINKIKSILTEGQAALVSSGANRFYLTGFNSSAGAVLITAKSSYFLIDFKYFEKAKCVVKDSNVILSSHLFSDIKEICLNENISSILVETNFVSISTFSEYQKVFDGITVLSENTLDKTLTLMRSIKTAEEIALIKKAQSLTDRTFSYITERISAGRTEREVMLDMEFFMRREGSEGVSFDFIVVSGKNSSLPHGVPTDQKIENGDFVTMDFGAVVGGYRSDMTRTVAVGGISELQKDVYNTVLKAQSAAISEIKPGVKCKNIDKIARDLIYGAGYEGCFGHGLGHSVGIEIHENPNFNTSCETLLNEGTVMTVEPGIYLENKFGVRIEDMVIVTENGCNDITESTKELIII